MLFDVDGVLTDGRLWYGPDGEELKAFHSLDGHGMKMLDRERRRLRPSSPAAAPRRSSAAPQSSASRTCCQGVDDKLAALRAAAARELGIDAAAAGFMGDELVDLPVMRAAASPCAAAGAPSWCAATRIT